MPSLNIFYCQMVNNLFNNCKRDSLTTEIAYCVYVQVVNSNTSGTVINMELITTLIAIIIIAVVSFYLGGLTESALVSILVGFGLGFVLFSVIPDALTDNETEQWDIKANDYHKMEFNCEEDSCDLSIGFQIELNHSNVSVFVISKDDLVNFDSCNNYDFITPFKIENKTSHTFEDESIIGGEYYFVVNNGHCVEQSNSFSNISGESYYNIKENWLFW